MLLEMQTFFDPEIPQKILNWPLLLPVGEKEKWVK